VKTWLNLTNAFPIPFDAEKMKADLESSQTSEGCLSHYDQCSRLAGDPTA
jgi:hypothetical protein